jgi:transcriptional regulator with XRE-family HTH domain
MLRTKDYIELARAKTGTKSDYAIAKLLNLRQQTIAQYREGRNVMDNETARRLAELLHLPLEELIASAEIERADRDGDDERRAAWVKRLKALGTRAAAVACAWLMAATYPGGGESYARSLSSKAVASAWACGTAATATTIDALTIMRSSGRRAWGALRAWLRELVTLNPPPAMAAP